MTLTCSPDYDSLPWYKKGCQWICGIEKMAVENVLSAEEKQALEDKQTSIHESSYWRRVLNINAVVVMTVAAFVWGFFS